MEFENVFYFKKINSIGGVESFFYYLSCKYKNFVVMYREGNSDQVKRLAHNVEVIKYEDRYGIIKCKKFFCNYGLDIQVEAEEKYHIIHCDYKNVNFKPFLYDDYKYIGVSQLACDNFKEITGIEAELIYNPIEIKKHNVPKLSDKIHLISATRLTKEKGGERINKLARLLDNAGIDYEWDIYSNRQYRWDSKNIIWKQTKLDLSKEIEESSYLVQLSDHESFGLSVCESLMLGTPVIITDIPAFKEIGCKHGINAVICDLNMKQVDLDLIKKGIGKFNYKPPRSRWDKYLSNVSSYNPTERIPVILRKRLWDILEDKHYQYGEEAEMMKWRVSELESEGIVERIWKK